MKRRGGSQSVSSPCFSSAVAVAVEDNEERKEGIRGMRRKMGRK